ncbi:MAG: macro domain-containing protein [Bdellovibrionota bacterium]
MKVSTVVGAGLVVLVAQAAVPFTASAAGANECHQLFVKQGLMDRLKGLVKPEAAAPSAAAPARVSVAVDSFDQARAKLAAAEDVALQVEQKEGVVRFNESIDDHIRSNPSYVTQLLNLALRRLPELKNEPFNLIVSGGVVEPWLPVLRAEIQRLGLDVNIIAFPGALSFARNDRIDAPDLPASLKADLEGRTTIFMDDTYTNGGTAEAIRQRVKESGGKLSGVFVIYEGGKGDPSSLYKSGRMNQRPTSMGQFAEAPKAWRNSSGIKTLGIELDGTLFVGGSSKLSLQGERLLRELSDLGISLVTLVGGRPVAVPASISSAFHGNTSMSVPDVSIGNWGQGFLGRQRPSKNGPSGARIETVRIGDVRTWSLWPEAQLDPNYLLNRLVEEGVLTPVVQQKRASTPKVAGRAKVIDLRNERKPSRPVKDILATADPKQRVAELSNVDWAKISESDRASLLSLAGTTTNSFEIGALIKIAAGSADQRWSPILAGWAAEWMPFKSGWQTYLYKDAVAALMKIEDANVRPLTEIDSKVSMEGTTNNGELKENMLPRGSALITSSGVLAQSGIKSIIHAATGAMTKQGGHYEPTLKSIELSVTNAVTLAERNGHKTIAIPLLGGGVFLQRLGVAPADLAARIITAAMQTQSKVELHFVAFAEADVMSFKEGRDQLRRLNVPVEDVRIDQGSITDFNTHGATVIVNAANTEVLFGGGLSGLIAKATMNSQAIDAEAAGVIARIPR